jgi:hypothetical protein
MLTSIKTKNIVILALVSTFILSALSSSMQYQVLAQGFFQSERNQTASASSIATEEENDTNALTQASTEDQKIILGDITIPITSDTQLSLEIPDSKITVEPNK